MMKQHIGHGNLMALHFWLYIHNHTVWANLELLVALKIEK